jgi:two-component system response regulator RegA
MGAMNSENYVLVLEEDSSFFRHVAEQLKLRGYNILVARSGDDAVSLAARYKPIQCVLGLIARGEHRLELVSALRAIVSRMHIVVATEYGSVATAVAAMKRGAKDYLAKPFKIEDLVAALRVGSPTFDGEASEKCPAANHLELRRVEWEYIQRVLLDCDGNITETARHLKVHRSTLQRKLSKHPVPEVSHPIH